MAFTAFGALKPHQKRAWVKEVMRHAREESQLEKYVGTGSNSVIQLVTELRKNDRGTDSAIIPLVQELQKDGRAGDNELEGHEESLDSAYFEIEMDMLSHPVTNKGRMDDQRSVINFRREAKNELGRWLADRCEQMNILALSGIGFQYNTNGSTRSTDSELKALRYAAQVSAPTTNRHRRISGSTIAAGDTTAITGTDKLNYDALVDLAAYAKETYMRPIRMGGREYFVFQTDPNGYAQLVKDSKINGAIVSAMPRAKDNPFFSGAMITVHGLVITEHRYTYNTTGISSGSKWGSGGTVNGTRSLLLGAQALGMVRIEDGDWTEKLFNYDGRLGIALRKISGIAKTKFYNPRFGQVEDYGVIAVDHAR